MFLKSIYSGIIFDVEEMPPFFEDGWEVSTKEAYDQQQEERLKKLKEKNKK